MSKEISVTLGVSCQKGNLTFSRASVTQKVDMAGTHRSNDTQDITTTPAALAISASVATPGITYLRNLDTTNFVQVGVYVSSTFYPLLKLLPGESQMVRLAITNPYAKADTATVTLEYDVLEA